MGLDGGVLHLHGSWWGWLLRVWRGTGHHDRAGVGALLLLSMGRRRRWWRWALWCEGWEGGVAWAGVVDECYAEHLGLAAGRWGCLLHRRLRLVEAGATDGLRWWWWGW